MEGIKLQSGFVERVLGHLEEPFTLIDVGCGGGIDSGWRSFGTLLHAVGFDPDVDEITRLQSEEAIPNVEYVAAFVRSAGAYPFQPGKLGHSSISRNPWGRLSVARSIELSEKQSHDSKVKLLNLWPKRRLVEPSSAIVLREFFSERRLHDIDFIKIDVDGPDYEILTSLDD